MRYRFVLFAFAAFYASLSFADGPKDNLTDNVRPIPPPGVEVPAAERQKLEAGVEELGKEIEGLRKSLAGKPQMELLPDVQIFHNAVRYALKYNEIHNPKELPLAATLIEKGKERAKQLREGTAPWTTATGLVPRGYVSKIDGSVQPYGLVVPASYVPGSSQPSRLDFWCHGRGETLSELAFVGQRLSSPGEFTPPGAIVCHLYGRYCNANKFAGEIDLFEALDSISRRYFIDQNRIVVRGFSMGGAACWQFATHYAGRFAAAAPGAGFSETADFLKVFQNEPVQPTWYEKKLWHVYDCTDYAINLFNCPTVAYSGEVDKQKQAADMMAAALKAEGIEMTHLIGPGMGHKYHPDSKVEINRRIDAAVARGRNPVPKQVRFTTWTLRYNQMLWVEVDGLGEHWQRARVDAEIVDPTHVRAKTSNVTALSFNMPSGYSPLDTTSKVQVQLDGTSLEVPGPQSDRSWLIHFRKAGSGWKLVESIDTDSLAKRPGLQGPIDDAFMDSFLMVRPTGQPQNAKSGDWAKAEMAHAVEHWRKQFRGEARVKDDAAVTDEDIAAHNLVLWGDPSSNKLLAKIAGKLPIRWTADSVTVGEKSYGAGHVPVLIYPNPLNPQKYVVLNSGFTYREYDYLNNARQVPKLPDWAVVDTSVPANSRWPGKIAAAGFFDERWQVKTAAGE